MSAASRGTPRLLASRCSTFTLLHVFLALLGVGVLMTCLLHLIFTPPSHDRVTPACPDLSPSPSNHSSPVYRPDCAAILAQDEAALRRARHYRWCRRLDRITDNDYVQQTRDCAAFRRARGYVDAASVTLEERGFPLAFSVLLYEEAEQAERLLRAVYRPHNVYCIHVDRNAASSVRRAMESVVGCLDNVFLASHPVAVTWSEFPVLQAEIECMHDLWRRSVRWRYFINLTGREFPLKTNLELVRILTTYNGSNDIDGTLHKRPKHWTDFVWRNQNHVTSTLKGPVPGGFLIGKGSAHIAASRAFVDYILHNATAQALLRWMRDIRAPDEHYFATLNHNPHKGVPGAYTGDPDLKVFQTRLKIWQSETDTCDGLWWRFICNWGVGDLYRLTGAARAEGAARTAREGLGNAGVTRGGVEVGTRPVQVPDTGRGADAAPGAAVTPPTELFLNKIKLEHDPIAFHCLEEWFRNRTRGGADVDLAFYRNLPWVKNHV